MSSDVPTFFTFLNACTIFVSNFNLQEKGSGVKGQRSNNLVYPVNRISPSSPSLWCSHFGHCWRDGKYKVLLQMFWWKRPGPASFKLGPQTSSYFYWKYGLGIGKISIGVDVVPGGHLYISLGMPETATDSTAQHSTANLLNSAPPFLHRILCRSYFADLSPVRSLFFVLANFLKLLCGAG